MLIIANSGPAETRDVLAGVLDACPGWEIVRCRSVAEAIQCGLPGAAVCLVLQSQPGEYSSVSMAELYDALPLTRLVVGLGAWCGSAMRREAVWPESTVVPMWGVIPRLRQELEKISTGRVPITAGREERILRGNSDLTLRSGMHVHIASPDRALREWLADLVRAAGGIPCGDSARQMPDGMIWDIDPWKNATLNRPSLGMAGPVVALTALPNTALSSRLRTLGATAVLGKPCDQADLLPALGAR